LYQFKGKHLLSFYGRGNFRPAGIQVAVRRVKHIAWRPPEPELFYDQSESNQY